MTKANWISEQQTRIPHVNDKLLSWWGRSPTWNDKKHGKLSTIRLTEHIITLEFWAVFMIMIKFPRNWIFNAILKIARNPKDFLGLWWKSLGMPRKFDHDENSARNTKAFRFFPINRTSSKCEMMRKTLGRQLRAALKAGHGCSSQPPKSWWGKMLSCPCMTSWWRQAGHPSRMFWPSILYVFCKKGKKHGKDFEGFLQWRSKNLEFSPVVWSLTPKTS